MIAHRFTCGERKCYECSQNVDSRLTLVAALKDRSKAGDLS